jgi:hypothetical protein
LVFSRDLNGAGTLGSVHNDFHGEILGGPILSEARRQVQNPQLVNPKSRNWKKAGRMLGQRSNGQQPQ